MDWSEAQVLRSAAFRPWVIRPFGLPLLQEDTFAGVVTAGTPKWGTLISAGGALAQDTGWFVGGAGSAKLTTNAAATNGSEIKTTLASLFAPGDLLAFEMKWCQAFAQSSTQLQFGLESRDHTNIKQARAQYTIATGKWQYEDGTLIYVDFPSPAATIERCTYNATAGTPAGWARIVIDPHAKTWYSFECPYSDGTNAYVRRWDMSGVALATNGASGTQGSLILPFVYVITQSATAEVAYTTDWCLSVIPASLRQAYANAGL